MRKKKKKKKKPMKNITINLPQIYIDNLQKLIDLNLIPNRSEGVRTAIREYLQDEFKNLEILSFFKNKKKKQENQENEAI
jgi:metal-responsive CopG/Arc/MetJ family transcriptional regulator